MAREFSDVWGDIIKDPVIGKFERLDDFKEALVSLVSKHFRLNCEYQNDDSPDFWDRHCGLKRSTQAAWIDTGGELKNLSNLIERYKKDLDSLIETHKALLDAINCRSTRLERCVLNDDSHISADLLDGVKEAFGLGVGCSSDLQAQEIVRHAYQGGHGIWESLADGLGKMRAVVPMVNLLVKGGMDCYRRAGLNRADSQKNVRLKIVMYDVVTLYAKHSEGKIIGRPKDNRKEAHDWLVDLVRLAFPPPSTITPNTVREALKAATDVWNDQKPRRRGEFFRQRKRISKFLPYS